MLAAQSFISHNSASITFFVVSEIFISLFSWNLLKFVYKIFVIALHVIIGLQNFSLSFCQS